MVVKQDTVWQVKVGEWEELSVTYESLAHQIARLLLANGGITRNMSDADYPFFRQLAMRRDLVSHMIQVLEYNSLNE